MPANVDFSFILNKPDRTFNAGDTINYKIIASVHKSFKARHLTVRFKGLAHIEWSSGKSKRKESQILFKDYKVLWTSGDSVEFNAGTYEYTGIFCLPDNIPTSFKHDRGYIEYNVKAKYDVPFDIDCWGSLEFFIQNNLNLNEYTNHNHPSNNSVEKRFSFCGCYTSDPLQIVVSLPKTIWIVGETIPITIQINNNSDVTIKKIKVKLMESILFTTTGFMVDYRIENSTVCKRVFETVLRPLQNKTFDALFSLDKGYPYKNTGDCKIIKCSYFIVATAVVKGLHTNLENKTQIFITHVPDPAGSVASPQFTYDKNYQ
uniref:CSON013882 protein n=1 Tax=Culicoides sonorensis TaxID=179676 RepID=A0A336KQ44_CULSO